MSKSSITTRPTGIRLPAHRAPTHPGEMLKEEFLKPLGITQVDFAHRIGVSFQTINSLVNGRRGITTDSALRLEAALGMPAYFWLELQLAHDLYNAKRSRSAASYRRIQRVCAAS